MQALLMFCTLLAPPWTWGIHSEWWHLEPDLPAVRERTEESHRTWKQRLLKLAWTFSVLMAWEGGLVIAAQVPLPQILPGWLKGSHGQARCSPSLSYLWDFQTSTSLSSYWHPTFQLPQCSVAPSPEGFLEERSFLFSFFMNKLHNCSPRDGATGPQAEDRGEHSAPLLSPLLR